MKRIIDKGLNDILDAFEKYGPFDGCKKINGIHCLITEWENEKYIIRFFDFGYICETFIWEKD